jgi:hypothetical protein
VVSPVPALPVQVSPVPALPVQVSPVQVVLSAVARVAGIPSHMHAVSLAILGLALCAEPVCWERIATLIFLIIENKNGVKAP